MAVVQPDFYRHENLVRKSIQILSTQHKELKALAVELEFFLRRCCGNYYGFDASR